MKILLVDPSRVEILPVVSSPKSLLALCREKNAVGGINGGFFNHSDGKLASFVFAENRWLGDPRKNLALMKNPSLKPYLKGILGRSELRIGKSGCRIEAHSAPYEKDFLASLQAGPRLLPELRLEKEAFLAFRGKKVLRDPLRFRVKIRRSAVGIRKNGEIVFLFLEKGDVFQLREEMRALGCYEAMALDGGSSSALAAGKRFFGASSVRCALLLKKRK